MEKLLPLIRELLEKFLLFLALKKAHDEGKEDAYQESLEDTLEDVHKAEEQKENETLRDIVGNKYDRSRMRKPSTDDQG